MAASFYVSAHVIGLVIGIVGLAFDMLLFGPIERWVQQRWGLSQA